jgi:phage FluMu gp28-like protein
MLHAVSYGVRGEERKLLEEYINMSQAFIRKNVVAVLIVLLAFVSGWKYLDMKKDVFEKAASARIDALREREDNLREREVDLAKDRAAFAESLSEACYPPCMTTASAERVSESSNLWLLTYYKR